MFAQNSKEIYTKKTPFKYHQNVGKMGFCLKLSRTTGPGNTFAAISAEKFFMKTLCCLEMIPYSRTP